MQVQDKSQLEYQAGQQQPEDEGGQADRPDAAGAEATPDQPQPPQEDDSIEQPNADDTADRQPGQEYLKPEVPFSLSIVGNVIMHCIQNCRSCEIHMIMLSNVPSESKSLLHGLWWLVADVPGRLALPSSLHWHRDYVVCLCMALAQQNIRD